MRFFLVARDRSSGEVRLVSDTTYESREQALDVLGDETASAAFAKDDLFVVDLDTVSPVVVYRGPWAPVTAPGSAQEPIADAWEAPVTEEVAVGGEAAVPEELPVEEVVAEATVVTEETDSTVRAPFTAGESAWDAVMAEELAASTAHREEQELPAEEVAEPEVEAKPEVEAEPVVEAEPEVEAEAVVEAEPEVEAEPASPEGEPADVEAAQEGESWDAVEEDLASALRKAASSMEESGIVAPPSVEEFATTGVASDTPAFEMPAAAMPVEEASVAVEDSPDMWPWEAQGGIAGGETEPDPDAGAAEPSADEVLAALQVVAPSGDAAVPGDVPAVSEGSGEVPGVEAIEAALQLGDSPQADAAAQDPGTPYAPIGIEEAGMEEISLLTPAEPASVIISAGDPELGEPAEGVVGTQAPGEGGIESYTCDDCVYVFTCPKNHQDGPATCGAFQWKPV